VPVDISRCDFKQNGCFDFGTFHGFLQKQGLRENLYNNNVTIQPPESIL
jgi:hypothetical protein